MLLKPCLCAPNKNTPFLSLFKKQLESPKSFLFLFGVCKRLVSTVDIHLRKPKLTRTLLKF